MYVKIPFISASPYVPFTYVYPGGKVQVYFVRYKCKKATGYTFTYIRHGHIVKVSTRCRECFWCYKHFSALATAKIMSKVNEMGIKQVYLWTFGTNFQEVSKLNDAWRKFTRRMSTYAKRESWDYTPILRSYEIGSKGKRAHVHAVFTGYFPHAYAREQWSKVTGISKPNVNFVADKNPKYFLPLNAVHYCVKYAVKGGSYRQMGKLLRHPKPVYTRTSYCAICKT